MITPIEIQKTEFKSAAAGYNKTQVDEFKAIILKNYEALYRQNLDLNDKVQAMSERITYYSSMEKSLHKALVLAEKSAEETRRSAQLNADAIEKDARAQAQVIINRAKQQLNSIYDATMDLVRQYDTYKAQMIATAEAQVKLLNSESFSVDLSRLDAYCEMLDNLDYEESLVDELDEAELAEDVAEELAEEEDNQ